MARSLWVAFLGTLATCLFTPQTNFADGNLRHVNDIIIVMQENHSFDNYFGVLPYTAGSPYHAPQGACAVTDHHCVDGLACTFDALGKQTCSNSNLDDNGATVFAFHALSRCVAPDLDHSWFGTHRDELS